MNLLLLLAKQQLCSSNKSRLKGMTQQICLKSLDFYYIMFAY